MPDLDAVLWDFGGVLTTSPFEAFNRYEQQRGLPADFLRGVNARNPDSNAWARFERSDIDGATFDRLFHEESAALGHPVPGSDVLGLLSGDLRPAVVAALVTVRQQFRTACITNNVRSGTGPGMSRSSRKAAAIAEVMDLFELVVESSTLGLRKPDPRIYQHTCEQLGVAPERCLFLDDLGINLKPARAMGMTTIKVTGEQQLLADLAAATGLDLG